MATPTLPANCQVNTVTVHTCLDCIMNNLKSLSISQKMLLIFSGLFLFVLPTPHTVTLRLLGLFTAAVLSFFVIKTRPMPQMPLKVPIILWVVVALLSVIWAVDPSYSLGEIKNEIIYVLLAYFVFYSATRGDLEWNWWMVCLVVIATIMSITAITLWYAGDITHSARYIYNGAGSYTTFVVTIFPYIMLILLQTRLNKFPNNLLWLLLPLLLIAAYLTDNRVFWIALSISALVLFSLLLVRSDNLYQRKVLLISIISILVISSAAFLKVLSHKVEKDVNVIAILEQTASRDPRLKVWPFVIEQIQQHPWIGKGFGRRSFNYAYPEILDMNPYFWHTHNIFLDYGIQMGIPGVLVFIIYFFYPCFFLLFIF